MANLTSAMGGRVVFNRWPTQRSCWSTSLTGRTRRNKSSCYRHQPKCCRPGTTTRNTPGEHRREDREAPRCWPANDPGIFVEAQTVGGRVHRVELHVGRGVRAVEQGRERGRADWEAVEGRVGEAVGDVALGAVGHDERVVRRVVLAAVVADEKLGPSGLHGYCGIPLVGLGAVIVDRDGPVRSA